MKDFITMNGGLLATIILAAMCFNFVLSGLQKALELIKDKTKTQLDNKLFTIIHGLTSFLSTLIDWFSANRAHA